MSARVIRAEPSGATSKSPSRQTFVPTARKIARKRFEAEEEARAVARQEGRAQGHAEATATLARAAMERDEVVERAIDVVVLAARAVAERALGQTLAIDDAALAGWAREALASLKHARRMVVRGSRKSIDRLSARLRDIAPGAPEAISLVIDDTIEDDAIHARSDVGEVSLELHTQLDALLVAVRDTVAKAVRGRVG